MTRARTAGRVDVRVAANTTAFDKGMRAAQRRIRKFTQISKSAGAQFAALGGIIGVTFGGGAILGAIRSATQLGDKMGNLSEVTGLSSERLRSLDTTLGISGISLDNYTKALTRSAQAVEYFLQGRGEYVQYFEDVGLKQKDFIAANGDVEKQLHIILTRLKEIQKTDNSLALAGAANLIGSRNTRLLALTDSFERDLREHTGITGNVSDAANARLQETNKHIDLFQRGIRNAFDNAIAANAVQIQGVIKDLSGTLPAAAEGAADLATNLGGVAAFILKYGDEFAALAAAGYAAKKIPGPAPVKIIGGAAVGIGTYYGLGGLDGEGKTGGAPPGSLHARRRYTDNIASTLTRNPFDTQRGEVPARAQRVVYTGPTGDEVRRVAQISEVGNKVGSLSRPLLRSEALALSGGEAGTIAGYRLREQFESARAASEGAFSNRYTGLEEQLARAREADPGGSKVRQLQEQMLKLEITSKAVSAEWDRQAKEVLPTLVIEAERTARTRLSLAEDQEKAEMAVTKSLEEQAERLARIKVISDEVSGALVSGLEEVVIGAKNAKEAFRELGTEIARIAFRQAVSQPIANAISSGLGALIGGIGGAIGDGVIPGVKLPADEFGRVRTATPGTVHQVFHFESGVNAAQVQSAIIENNDVILRAASAQTYGDLTRPGSRLSSTIR